MTKKYNQKEIHFHKFLEIVFKAKGMNGVDELSDIARKDESPDSEEIYGEILDYIYDKSVQIGLEQFKGISR
jgi:hypothetical protein